MRILTKGLVNTDNNLQTIHDEYNGQYRLSVAQIWSAADIQYENIIYVISLT